MTLNYARLAQDFYPDLQICMPTQLLTFPVGSLIGVSGTYLEFLIFSPPSLTSHSLSCLFLSVSDNSILPCAQAKQKTNKQKTLFLSCVTSSWSENPVASIFKNSTQHLTTLRQCQTLLSYPQWLDYVSHLQAHLPASTIECLCFLYFSQSQIIPLLFSKSSNWGQGLNRATGGEPGTPREDQMVKGIMCAFQELDRHRPWHGQPLQRFKRGRAQIFILKWCFDNTCSPGRTEQQDF